MTMLENKSRTTGISAIRTVTTASLMLCCITIATAANNPDVAPIYVDSVNSWGTWELGIEPAAGPQPAAARVMTAPASNVQFRPNDNAAYRPNAVQANANMPTPGNPPPPVPAIPPGTAQGTVGSPPPTGDPRNR